MLGKFSMERSSPKDTINGYMTMLETEAGIIPRTIHHTFQELERQVKIRISL